MPLERLNNQDRLTPLVKFKTSTLLEMLISLQTAVQQWLHQEWTEKIKEHLGEKFLENLRQFYHSLDYGCEFIEMALEYPDQQDVEGFLQHAINLNDRDFIFYMLGRIYKKEELPEKISQKSMEAFIKNHPNEYSDCIQHNFYWADDLPAVKNKMKDIFLHFWRNFFKDIVPSYEKTWISSIQEKQHFLLNYGGPALLESTSGKTELPNPLPIDQPYKQIDFIPIFNAVKKSRMYYGYGNISILFNCRQTAKQSLENEELKKNLLLMFRALGDENRFKLLTLIADEPKQYQYNGKKLAQKLNLSPSVVSRHLTQLRDSGLIEEIKEDNRNITYRLVWDNINHLSDHILQVLRD
ncbi:MAG: MarR family transcriptional regulator [Spirochaetes bacterium]|nr:MarR family transcriptional regulator [Spirochaetota bacterium]